MAATRVTKITDSPNIEAVLWASVRQCTQRAAAWPVGATPLAADLAPNQPTFLA
jgi:hypothetical protein